MVADNIYIAILQQKMDEELKSLMQQLAKCETSNEFTNVRSKFLGPKSMIQIELKNLKNLLEEERKLFGVIINQTKDKIQTIINLAIQQHTKIKYRMLSNVEITAPVYPILPMLSHPLTVVSDKITDILEGMGMTFTDGPEIETSWYNFTALNVPQHHPARLMHDTFYLTKDKETLLRTHTSPVQIRAVQQYGVPLSVFTIGKVYRQDYDASHLPMFHQIEGLIINDYVSFAHLKWLVTHFLRRLFDQPDMTVKFRASYFPFTKPSVEIDIVHSNGQLIEVMGCGMVHENVLRAMGIDSNKYKGIAFGAGLERLTALIQSIDDIREYFDYKANSRFL